MGTLNPSFETPGAAGYSGQAESWSEGYGSGADDIANFYNSDGDRRPWEDFENSWDDNHLYQLAFGIPDLIQAFFCNDSIPRENFESGWKAPQAYPGDGIFNQASAFEFSIYNFLAAAFDTGGTAEDHEDFEEDWGLSPYNQSSQWQYDGANFYNATFDAGSPEGREDFEEEWQDNENATSSFEPPGAGNLSVALQFWPYIATGYDAFDGPPSWTTVLP